MNNVYFQEILARKLKQREKFGWITSTASATKKAKQNVLPNKESLDKCDLLQ